MKIGIYYYSPFETGGCEKTILERGKILKNQGHEVTFIYGTKKPQLNMLKQYAKVGNVRQQDYVDQQDIMIYDSIYNNKMIPAQMTIQVINGNVIEGQETLKTNQFVDKYVCVSNECAKQLKQKYDIDSEVISNAINTEQIRELAKEKYDLPKKKYNFVVVSRVDQVKGFENLIQFIKKIDEKTKDYQFVIVGSNFYFPNYQMQVKERLKGYNVIWEGMQNNPYKYMANADYLVQLSKYESQCMVMHESLILGIPVIATDFATAKETITKDRGFVLKQDLSNLCVNDIIDNIGKYNIKYDYVNIEEKWKEVIKPPKIVDKKFSIIVPNYNNAEWLDKCLTSIAEQTYKNYEVIFIDDVSTDNSVDIAYEYIEKIKEFQIIKLSQKRYNGGTRNVGIELATGDYILFIDSDDWLINNTVLEELNRFTRNEDIIRTGYSLSNGTKHDLFIDIPKTDTLEKIFKEDTCACWTKLIKTKLLKQVLFPEGTLCEDRVWHYRLIEQCKSFRNFPKVTHIWNRANKHSTTTERSIEWEASCYKHLGELYKFIHTSQNEEYKKFVQNRFKIHHDNLMKGVYTQL